MVTIFNTVRHHRHWPSHLPMNNYQSKVNDCLKGEIVTHDGTRRRTSKDLRTVLGRLQKLEHEVLTSTKDIMLERPLFENIKDTKSQIVRYQTKFRANIESNQFWRKQEVRIRQIESEK